MEFTAEEILKLTEKPLPKFSNRDCSSGLQELNSCMNLLFLIIYDIENKTYDENVRKYVHAYIQLSIKNIINKGYEPSFDNGHCWGYAPFAASIALIKKFKSLRELFTTEEHEKMEWIMKMFALMWNFGCNSKNNYSTGIGLHGNFFKKGSPNYMLTNNIMYLYCLSYLGGGKAMSVINRLFNEISYEKVIEKLEEYNWKNALEIWTSCSFKIDEDTIAPGAAELFGNRKDSPNGYAKELRDAFYIKNVAGKDQVFYAGSGHGCCIPFYYKNVQNSNDIFPAGIYEEILDLTFSGGKVLSRIPVEIEEDYECKIFDGTSSPYEGEEGMMLEFNSSKESHGFRSSLQHCEIDFYLVATFIVSAKYLFGINLSDIDIKDKIIVGMGDCIYKKQHGYYGYCMGVKEKFPPNSEIFKDITYWMDYWTQFVEDNNV